MEYKPVWPASGRDFCSRILIRELGEGVFGLASDAVGDLFCKSLVCLKSFAPPFLRIAFSLPKLAF